MKNLFKNKDYHFHETINLKNIVDIKIIISIFIMQLNLIPYLLKELFY